MILFNTRSCIGMAVVIKILALEIKGCPGYRLITLHYSSLSSFVGLSKFRSIYSVFHVDHSALP